MGGIIKIQSNNIRNQKEFSSSEKIKLIQIISNYIVPKTKLVRVQFTLQELVERTNRGVWDSSPDPTT